MTYDEGLYSYKAIAFIADSRPINYLKLAGTPQKNVLSKQKTLRYISKNLGEKYYG